MTRRTRAKTSATRIAGGYFAAGVLWIVLADRIVSTLFVDPTRIAAAQAALGAVFLAASAGVFAWLVRREARRAERAESRFQALAGQGIVGTFAVRDGTLVHVNARLAETFGYARPEMEQTLAFTDLAAAEDRSGLEALSGGAAPEAVSTVRHRFTGLRKDGTRVPVEIHGRATEWDGAPAMAGVLLDLSSYVRLDDRLCRAGRLEALGQLTGSVAHDLNNFLTVILGNLELVALDIPSNPTAAEESLHVVRDAATRAANLTSRLLGVSRDRAFQPRPLDLNAHLSTLADVLRTLADGGRTVALDLDVGLPSVLLDPVALDQVMMNLFVNAKQATAAGGTIVLRTRASRTSAEAGATVEVEDDGVGMERAVLDRMCEPFFTTKERGTGLGLATVRRIVDQAHGHLTVDSVPGRGTTVRLFFPAVVRFPGSGDPQVPGVGAVTARPGARILVADGDAAVAGVVTAALRRAGYQATEATRGEEVLALAREAGGFDLVLLDSDVPGIPHPALAARLRADHPGTRLVTLGTPQDDGQHDPALRKPFSAEQMLAVVGRSLDEGAGRLAREG